MADPSAIVMSPEAKHKHINPVSSKGTTKKIYNPRPDRMHHGNVCIRNDAKHFIAHVAQTEKFPTNARVAADIKRIVMPEASILYADIVKTLAEKILASTINVMQTVTRTRTIDNRTVEAGFRMMFTPDIIGQDTSDAINELIRSAQNLYARLGANIKDDSDESGSSMAYNRYAKDVGVFFRVSGCDAFIRARMPKGYRCNDLGSVFFTIMLHVCAAHVLDSVRIYMTALGKTNSLPNGGGKLTPSILWASIHISNLLKTVFKDYAAARGLVEPMSLLDVSIGRKRDKIASALKMPAAKKPKHKKEK